MSFGLFASTAYAPATSADVFQIHYAMECHSDSASLAGSAQPSRGNVMHGALTLKSSTGSLRELRVYAAQGQGLSEIEIGQDSVRGRVVWSDHPRCELQELIEGASSRALASSSLPEQHSPLLMLSRDQQAHPESDVPLALAYSWVGNRLRYTLFLSDENSLSSSSATEKQMARYGRRSDIEWIYEVEFGGQGQVVARRYQGGVLFGMGHRTYTFRGGFVEGTQHPILHDVATHHVFSDKPRFWATASHPVGVSLVAREEIKSPYSRESFLFRHPWIAEVTDREVRAEGKCAGLTSEDYLYVFLDGELKSGSFRWEFAQAGRKTVSRGTIDRLGEGLFGTQSFAALPVGKSELNRVAAGGAFGPGAPLRLKLNDASSDLELRAKRVSLHRYVRDAKSGELAFRAIPVSLDCKRIRDRQSAGIICQAL